LPKIGQGGPPGEGAASLSVRNVRGKVHLVKGGAGANGGFFVAGAEVLVIDAKMTEDSARRMLAEIEEVTPNPVTRVVLTHGDGDHVNGLGGFPRGIAIIAQDNTRASMAKASESTRQRTPLPSITFSDKLTLYVPGESKETRVDLLYFRPAQAGPGRGFRGPSLVDLIFLELTEKEKAEKN
jgi:glyoxylase-like metal-dependent hydrolase (beta-lactamase superfamily II)